MYTAIGHRFRHLRNKKGFTQDQVAEKAGISLSFYGHIERGTRKLSVETLIKLVNVLECSADEILGTGKKREMSLAMLLMEAARKLEA